MSEIKLLKCRNFKNVNIITVVHVERRFCQRLMEMERERERHRDKGLQYRLFMFG